MYTSHSLSDGAIRRRTQLLTFGLRPFYLSRLGYQTNRQCTASFTSVGDDHSQQWYHSEKKKSEFKGKCRQILGTKRMHRSSNTLSAFTKKIFLIPTHLPWLQASSIFMEVWLNFLKWISDTSFEFESVVFGMPSLWCRLIILVWKLYSSVDALLTYVIVPKLVYMNLLYVESSSIWSNNFWITE